MDPYGIGWNTRFLPTCGWTTSTIGGAGDCSVSKFETRVTAVGAYRLTVSRAGTFEPRVDAIDPTSNVLYALRVFFRGSAEACTDVIYVSGVMCAMCRCRAGARRSCQWRPRQLN